MNLTIHVPDDLATRIVVSGADLERRVLEALALWGYRAGRLNKPELCGMLDFETGASCDGFLKEHGVSEGIPPAEPPA